MVVGILGRIVMILLLAFIDDDVDDDCDKQGLWDKAISPRLWQPRWWTWSVWEAGYQVVKKLTTCYFHVTSDGQNARKSFLVKNMLFPSFSDLDFQDCNRAPPNKKKNFGRFLPNVGGWRGWFPNKVQTPKKNQTTPKIAFFDPNFTFRFPKSHKNPGVGG